MYQPQPMENIGVDLTCLLSCLRGSTDQPGDLVKVDDEVTATAAVEDSRVRLWPFR